MQNAIAYYRASRKRQGQSGLGLEAQQNFVDCFLEVNPYNLLYGYIEIKSGKRNFMFGLKKVLEDCKKYNAVLLIAKLDRLSRSVAFISALMDSKIEFKVVTMPFADRFTLHILAAVAEKEREDTSQRTVEALAAAKRRGTKMGLYGKYVLSIQNRFLAEQFALAMKPIIEKLQDNGFKTVRAIVAELNSKKIPTYRNDGSKWHLSTVHKVLEQLSHTS